MSVKIDAMKWDRLPAKVQPETGSALCGFAQDAPRAAFPAELRLRAIGFLTHRPDWDGVIATGKDGVNHWVHISANEAVSMMGFLTPQMISDFGGSATPDKMALEDTMSRPERLASHLRSAQLAGDVGAITGHLVGAELAAARVYWLGQQVALIDDGISPYRSALEAQGGMVVQASAADMEEQGLSALKP